MVDAMQNGRRSHSYRPGIAGIELEGRVVLSTGQSLWQIRHFLIGDNLSFLRTQYASPSTAAPITVGANYNTQFQAGFVDTLRAAETASANYLANLTGTNASTARATFDTAVKGALDALTAQLTSQLAQLTPASNGLTSRVQQMILSAGPTSLASVLKSVPAPATGTGADATAFDLKLSGAIAATRETAVGQLNVFLANNRLTHRHTIQNVSGRAVVDSTANHQNLALVQEAFAGLANDYANGAGPWLGGADTASITTNRNAFDLNAQSAVNSLTSILMSSLSLTPNASSALIPAIQERLLGSNGLLDELFILPDPTDQSGASAAGFGTQASQAISAAYKDVTKLYKNFARGKTIAPTLSTGYNANFGGGFGGFGNGYIPAADATTKDGLDFVPTLLQQFGFNNTLLNLGPNGPTFTYGKTQYGQSNGLSLTSGFNFGFNSAFTTSTGLNYKQVGTLVK
jgi:hypothetical protein